jgi:hypothetical protein
MSLRTLKRLPVLLAILAFCVFLQLQPASADSCNTVCWQTCMDNYQECRADGIPNSVCCQHANQCSGVCGSTCPLFC